MISVRGPQQILVVDRVAVPVTAVCDAVIDLRTKSEVRSVLPITESELFGAIDAMVNIVGINHRDYINFSCDRQLEDITVETDSVTDNVYLSALLFGYDLRPQEDHLFSLYAHGVESIMYDCLLDCSHGSTHYMHSELHSLIYDAFCKAFGEPTPDEILKLLECLIDEGISK